MLPPDKMFLKPVKAKKFEPRSGTIVEQIIELLRRTYIKVQRREIAPNVFGVRGLCLLNKTIFSDVDLIGAQQKCCKRCMHRYYCNKILIQY